MKRRDLQVGQKVAVLHNRDGDYFSEAYVVDTEPWKRSTGFSARYVGRSSSSGQGVAIAVRRVFRDEVRWYPEVQTLAKLQPYEEVVATRDRARAAQLQRRTREAEVRTVAITLGNQLRERIEHLGVPVPYTLRSDFSYSRGQVTLSLQELVAILDAAENAPVRGRDIVASVLDLPAAEGR